mmetsp:Transcript_96768/g.153167  ORF Transcript_96768/g.153167 Transcript_96768/m.153167 type:complete len:312 (-) Transcript_96768:119-1054(-)|eukprot:CAMPEP_0169122684 /NCGR_PEP_ID=MMETSP1015-20121227/33366_1 /TAXON_ID=342587 /ORGANISM="Karlodinium micrum, Strain CCMP2283" /LENGTH=311 /DNA_ID=CAMNT_0009185937 /DNA_START=48 /DNA_END=983 /DNA_ORIENTATION=-
MSYVPTTVSYLPPMATQVASASWVPPQAVETVMYESVQPVMYESVQAVRAVAQPVVAMAQPVYAQTAVAQAISSVPSVAVGSLQELNQAINAGEVAKPTGAAAYYELYCRMNGQTMPAAVASTAAVVSQQPVYAVEQVMASPSYLPPAPVVYETVPSYAPVTVEKVMMPEYAMAEQMQTYSYIPQYTEPTAVAAPVMAAPVMAAPSYAPSYAPMMAVAAPGVAMQQGQPESVILDEVGDWLVCEDAAGLFYHHAPTQQSYDDPPFELVQYYERQGIQLAPTGAFGVQAAMVQQAPMQMTYTVAQTMPGAYY